MEEKKLTDEEIVKGLENWILQDCSARIEDLTNAHDLIHRLQIENEKLSDKNATLECENSELKQRVSILEADNDDYKDKIAENELVSIDWHNEQVGHLEEEIERLTKRLELADKDNDNLAKTIFDYEKQVDELKRCPFCGGKAVVEEIAVTTKKFPKKSQAEYYVQCVICLTKTKQSAHKHALVDLWNNKGKR